MNDLELLEQNVFQRLLPGLRHKDTDEHASHERYGAVEQTQARELQRVPHKLEDDGHQEGATPVKGARESHGGAQTAQRHQLGGKDPSDGAETDGVADDEERDEYHRHPAGERRRDALRVLSQEVQDAYGDHAEDAHAGRQNEQLGPSHSV